MVIRLAMAILLMGGAARAESLHDVNNPAHWYPSSCCSQRDCEPIPIDGITETRSGWKVHYVSVRFGAIDEMIPLGEARHSQDGGFHGCWRRDPTKPRTICFFVPLNS
jgi:hypothetical protein